VSESLPCPRCGGPSDLASWLDRADAQLAPAESLRAACPRCDAEQHLALRSGDAAIGSLSPAPALFRPERRLPVAGLEVRARFDHVEVILAARSWRFRR
jgi:ribosomal protein S27AE